jgi:hypothetical protein
MSHRGASGVGRRPRHLSLEQTDAHRAPLPGLRRPYRSSTGSPQILAPLNINASLLARATSVAPFGQRRLVVVTKDDGATWSSPIDVTGMTGPQIRKRILYLVGLMLPHTTSNNNFVKDANP